MTTRIPISIDPHTLSHAAEITADYALQNNDEVVAQVTLDILDALILADERPGAANLVRRDLEIVIERRGVSDVHTS